MSFDGYAFVGLNARAKKLVAGEQKLAYTEEVIRRFPDGSWSKIPNRQVFESTVKCEESGERINDGQWIDRPLMKYTIPDGRVYVEQKQYGGVADSYGYALLALQDEQGNNWLSESLWTNGEISKLITDLQDDQTKIGQDGEYWVMPVSEARPGSGFVTQEEMDEWYADACRGQVVGDKVIVDGLEHSIDDYEFLGLYREGETSPGVRPEKEETEDVNVSEFE
ncbi:MAG: hypothetical protein AAB345_03960 [Patescibacteria group bacterium]